MKSRKVKLSAKAKEQLARDPRIKALWETAKERELNVLEQIILNQLLKEAQAGVL